MTRFIKLIKVGKSIKVDSDGTFKRPLDIGGFFMQGINLPHQVDSGFADRLMMANAGNLVYCTADGIEVAKDGTVITPKVQVVIGQTATPAATVVTPALPAPSITLETPDPDGQLTLVMPEESKKAVKGKK